MKKRGISFWSTVLAGQFLLLILWDVLQAQTEWIEAQYAQGFFPRFSMLYKSALYYLPFSVGDLIYVAVVVGLVMLVSKFCIALFRKQLFRGVYIFLLLLNSVLALYHIFAVNWGLNYYRVPVERQLGLEREQVYLADYLQLLNSCIDTTNLLRTQRPTQAPTFKIMQADMEALVAEDTLLNGYLAQGNLRLKKSLLAPMISAFGVSGYLNPFSLEAHVNQQVPPFTLPFTMVHELAHQQGIGFEDEANFIAFEKLKNHPNIHYRYAANYQLLTYMLMELRGIDNTLYQAYLARLSQDVVIDMEEEQAFWKEKTGWIAQVTTIFYNSYLQHNNQAEGVARYNRMTRLVLSSYLKEKGC